jgi:hypothetical protein
MANNQVYRREILNVPIVASATIPAFSIIRGDAANTVSPAAAVGDRIIGVLSGEIDVPAGSVADVGVLGVYQVRAGAAIAQIGAKLTTDATARAVVSAAATDSILGKSLSTCTAAGQIISVLVD